MRLMVILMCLLIAVPCYPDALSVADIDRQIDAEMTADTDDNYYWITQTDKDGNTWLLVDRGEVKESKILLTSALIILGVAGWCNKDLYGALAGTAFFMGAASIKF